MSRAQSATSYADPQGVDRHHHGRDGIGWRSPGYIKCRSAPGNAHGTSDHYHFCEFREVPPPQFASWSDDHQERAIAEWAHRYCHRLECPDGDGLGQVLVLVHELRTVGYSFCLFADDFNFRCRRGNERQRNEGLAHHLALSVFTSRVESLGSSQKAFDGLVELQPIPPDLALCCHVRERQQ